MLSLSPGATLGSVSDAAVCSSALWPGGGGEEVDNDENEDEKEKDDDDDELHEWLARHTVDFLDAAALLQGALSHQFCTPETCPAMRAGPRHEYLWAEPEIPGGGEAAAAGEGGGTGAGAAGGEASSASESAAASAASAAAHPPRKEKPALLLRAPSSSSSSSSRRAKKPCRLPARDYAAALFAWADALLACPRAFPQARGEPFPPGFRAAVLRPLYRRLARVFAHLYHAHWREVVGVLGAAAHLNTVFKHYVAFGREHGLLPEGELDAVRPLVQALLPQPPPMPPVPPPPMPPTAGKRGGGGGGEGGRLRPQRQPPQSSSEASAAAAASAAASTASAAAGGEGKGKGKGARVEVSASSAAVA